MSRGCRPAPGAAGLPLVPRRPEQPRQRARAPPGRAVPRAAPGYPARVRLERPPSPAGGHRGQEAPGRGAGGMLEVWVGRLRREAPARPGLRVPPGTAPSSGAADPQPGKAARSLPTEAAGWRCPVERGSGRIRAQEGCHRAGAEPQPLLRTGQSSCPAPGSPGWPSTASPRRSRPEAIGGKASCRAARAGEGSRPWAPAGRGRLQPRPPARAAVALLPPPQPPPHRKEQREK